VDLNIAVIHAIDRLNTGMTQLAQEIKTLRDREDRITADTRQNTLKQKRINKEAINMRQNKTDGMNKETFREAAKPPGSQPRLRPKVKFDGRDSDGSCSSSSVRVPKRQRKERNNCDNYSAPNRNNTYLSNQGSVDFSSYKEEEAFPKTIAVTMPGEDSIGASSRDTTS